MLQKKATSFVILILFMFFAASSWGYTNDLITQFTVINHTSEALTIVDYSTKPKSPFWSSTIRTTAGTIIAPGQEVEFMIYSDLGEENHSDAGNGQQYLFSESFVVLQDGHNKNVTLKLLTNLVHTECPSLFGNRSCILFTTRNGASYILASGFSHKVEIFDWYIMAIFRIF